MMKMGGNAAFSFRFSFVTEGLGGNAPFFKVFLTIFSVFERQCTVFLTLFGPIFRLGLDRFLGGYAPFYPCMALEIDSFKRRIIHRNTKYSNLFKPGDEVKLWYYRMHGEYQIVQAKRGDEILIKHNSILANIVFVLMVGSFVVVLLELLVKKVLPKRD
jgi:hypothetical protein